jgi:hypothetical protein
MVVSVHPPAQNALSATAPACPYPYLPACLPNPLSPIFSTTCVAAASASSARATDPSLPHCSRRIVGLEKKKTATCEKGFLNDSALLVRVVFKRDFGRP